MGGAAIVVDGAESATVVRSGATAVVVVLVPTVLVVVCSAAGSVGGVAELEGGVEFGSAGSLTSAAPEHALTARASAMPVKIRDPRCRAVRCDDDANERGEELTQERLLVHGR